MISAVTTSLPPEDGQTTVTEICRVLMMCFTKVFNNLVF
jgi:hypothetical protein